MIKEKIQTIGSKEMNRKDFLRYGGLIILSVIGFRGVINLLSTDKTQELLGKSKSESKHGFGGGRYGV